MRLKLFRVALLGLALLRFALISANAYPSEPLSLRQLFERSEAIVWVKVEKESNEEEDYPFMRKSPARLLVLEALKGKVAGKIQVEYYPGSCCPAPPDYPGGSNVLTFLRYDRMGRLETVGLSYGTMSLSEKEFQAHKQAISSLASIYGSGAPNTNELVEWIVSCAEDPITRPSAVPDLVDGARFKNVPSPFAAFLTPEHYARLSNAVFKTEFIRHGDLALLEMFQNNSPQKVVNLLISYLKRASQRVQPMVDKRRDRDSLPDPVAVSFVLARLLELVPDERAQKVFAGFSKPPWPDHRIARERIKQISKFLPEIERAAKAKGYL